MVNCEWVNCEWVDEMLEVRLLFLQKTLEGARKSAEPG